MQLPISRPLEGADLGADGTITLFRTDGTLIMRTPFDQKNIGSTCGPRRSSSVCLTRRPAILNRLPLDGIQRLYVYQQMGDLPLV